MKKSEPEGQAVLVKHAWPHPLRGKSLEVFERDLRDALSGRVIEAYLFGSVAAAEYSERSDVDLILVCETPRPFVERYQDFRDILDCAARMDLLVYTPQEFEEIKRAPHAGFWKSVFDGIRRLV